MTERIQQPAGFRFKVGDSVRKKRGARWRGTVVGFYSTFWTLEGYCVESAFERGSVQIYPVDALEPWTAGPGEKDHVA